MNRQGPFKICKNCRTLYEEQDALLHDLQCFQVQPQTPTHFCIRTSTGARHMCVLSKEVADRISARVAGSTVIPVRDDECKHSARIPARRLNFKTANGANHGY